MQEGKNHHGRIQRLLLRFSGADVARLEGQGDALDRIKHASLGLAVLLTGLFATLSGGYALMTIFGNLLLAIPIALLWGLSVCNTDRLVSSQIHKRYFPPGTPLRVRGAAWLGLLLLAAPRLFLAAIIATTVAVPLELAVCESEVELELAMQATRAAADAEAILASEFAEIGQLEELNQALRKEIVEKEKQRDSLRRQVSDEHAGSGGDGLTGLHGPGPHWKFLVEELAKTEAEVERFRKETTTRLAANEERLQDLRSKQDTRRGQLKAEIQNPRGLLKRLMVLHALSDSNPVVRGAVRYLTLLLLALELTPLLLALGSPAGKYDAEIHSQVEAAAGEAVRGLAEAREMAEADADARRRTAAVLREWRSKQALEVRLEAEHSRAMKNARVALVKDHVEALAEELRAELRRTYTATRLETERLRREVVREVEKKSREKDRELFEVEKRLNGERHRAMETLTREMREQRDPLTTAVKGEKNAEP